MKELSFKRTCEVAETLHPFYKHLPPFSRFYSEQIVQKFLETFSFDMPCNDEEISFMNEYFPITPANPHCIAMRSFFYDLLAKMQDDDFIIE